MEKDGLPTTGFLRLDDIIGHKEVTEEEAERNRRDAKAAKECGKKPNNRPKRPRRSSSGVIPVGSSSWWEGVRNGRYPKPVKLGLRTTAWRVEDIRALIRTLHATQ
jgi:hypothetical protein